MKTWNTIRNVAVALALVAGAAGTASAQSSPAPAAYNPPVGANPFPIAEGYSWTFRDASGNLHDIRCTEFAANSGIASFHNLSGKNEYTEVRNTLDQFRQPIVEAREMDRRRGFSLWGKRFASRYPWTWLGTDDVTLRGERRSTWYRSAQEPAGTFLRPLVYDIAPAPGVADAGIEQIALVPGVGIVEQTFTTIAGPRTWELLSANTAAGQIPAILHGVETKITVTPGSFTWPGILPQGTGGYRPPMISVTLEARVRAGTRIVHPLTFTSTQRIDVEFYDEDGALAYRWSDGRMFGRSMMFVDLKEGQPFRATVTDIPMPSAIMDFRGRYRVRAFITDRDATQGKVRFGAQTLFACRAGV